MSHRTLAPGALPLLPHAGPASTGYEHAAALLEQALAKAVQDPALMPQLSAALSRLGRDAGRA